MYKYFCKQKFSFFLGLALLGCRAGRYFFDKNLSEFSKLVVLFYIPTSTDEFWLLHIFTNVNFNQSNEYGMISHFGLNYIIQLVTLSTFCVYWPFIQLHSWNVYANFFPTLKNSVIWLFIIELSGLFIYSEYKFFDRYM